MLTKRTSEHDLPLPGRETAGSAGYDLRSVENVKILPGESKLVDTGFAFAIPDGWVGLIRDRSGLAAKRRITTRAGVIDSDYRGSVMIVMVNEGSDWYEIWAGERIAQMVIVPFYGYPCEENRRLTVTDRDSNGFGSTGTD